jgi:hypothetical protein
MPEEHVWHGPFTADGISWSFMISQDGTSWTEPPLELPRERPTDEGTSP